MCLVLITQSVFLSLLAEIGWELQRSETYDNILIKR